MKDGLEHMKNSKEELCRLRVNAAMNNKSPPWTMDELEIVLNGLKNYKARDPLGYVNELFDPDVAGKDLKVAILMMMKN